MLVRDAIVLECLCACTLFFSLLAVWQRRRMQLALDRFEQTLGTLEEGVEHELSDVSDMELMLQPPTRDSQ